MRLGAHVSVAGGPTRAVERAVERGCEAVQIFSSNPRGWALSKSAPDGDRELRSAFEAKDIRPIVLHTPYLVNLAAVDDDIYTKSVASLVHAADRARRMDGLVVVHAGRDQINPRPIAVRRAAAAVLAALKLVADARILVEPTAGGRGSVAARMDELGELLEMIDDDRVGVCLDTCHAFASGYDLSTAAGAKGWLSEVDRHVGFDRVGALHINDSRDGCGSNRDRHWHLGQGEIGETGLRAVLSDPRLSDVPGICETPGDASDDIENLKRAQRLATPGGSRGRPRPTGSRGRSGPRP